ncbi:MAG: M20/M25/M40 family metallo-hydrolase [Armatimonadetes bacterium]|nr:M20/M25/M40 family metallo-hydrolase [Armatimonadota bacterium]
MNTVSVPVNEPRLLETFLALLRFNTPSRHEKPATDFCADYLRNLGFTITFDDAGEKVGGNASNLFAFKAGTVVGAPPIFFSSHLDTVEATPNIEISVIDGVVRSVSDTILGADDTSGVAPILEAMTFLAESGEAHGDIQVILTICEEIGLVGAKQIDPANIKARYGFVLDGGPPMGGVTITAPSQNNLRVRVVGKPSHAGGSPELGINAIAAAASAIHFIKQGRIDPETTANIGTIQGGTARNIVPAEAFIVAEARSRDNEKLAKQTAHMVEIFEREATAIGARAEIEVEEGYRTYRLNADDPVIGIAQTAAKTCGYPFALRESGGGSDANIFNALGVPTCVLACGMQAIHTHDEFCEVADLVKSAAWVVEIVRVARRFSS